MICTVVTGLTFSRPFAQFPHLYAIKKKNQITHYCLVTTNQFLFYKLKQIYSCNINLKVQMITLTFNK